MKDSEFVYDLANHVLAVPLLAVGKSSSVCDEFNLNCRSFVVPSRSAQFEANQSHQNCVFQRRLTFMLLQLDW